MVTGQRNDPFRSCNFVVEIGGVAVGGFSEVSGLEIETEVKEYREGGENGYIHKLAGPTRYTRNLVLKNGFTADSTLWDWYRNNRDGVVQKKTGSIVFLDMDRSEVARFNFYEAYPVKWVGPGLNALRAEIGVESLELAHHRLERA
jgi:phage tail-like protein